MKIHKLINNNIIVVLDDHKKEKIIMGRGLGYRKKAGDIVDEKQIEKVFCLSDSQYTNQLFELLKEIPIECIRVSYDIIDYATRILKKQFNDYLIVSLCDHIYTALERAKEQIFVKNILFWEIKRFYPDEYQIGMKSLEMIKDATNILLPDDEAGFIALHLVNAQLGMNDSDMYEITKIMQDMTNIVKYYFRIQIEQDSVYFYRFITHLKFFAQRLLSGKIYTDDASDQLLSIVKEKYAESYKCVKKIMEYVYNNYSHVLSDEEQLYLTIHIERIVSKSR